MGAVFVFVESPHPQAADVACGMVARGDGVVGDDIGANEADLCIIGRSFTVVCHRPLCWFGRGGSSSSSTVGSWWFRIVTAAAINSSTDTTTAAASDPSSSLGLLPSSWPVVVASASAAAATTSGFRGCFGGTATALVGGAVHWGVLFDSI